MQTNWALQCSCGPAPGLSYLVGGLAVSPDRLSGCPCLVYSNTWATCQRGPASILSPAFTTDCSLGRNSLENLTPRKSIWGFGGWVKLPPLPPHRSCTPRGREQSRSSLPPYSSQAPAPGAGLAWMVLRKWVHLERSPQEDADTCRGRDSVPLGPPSLL